MHTIEHRVALTGGHSTGFDYLRLSLSIAILSTHALRAVYGPNNWNAIWPSWLQLYFVPALVPCFFALSGYLVAGSLERCRTIITFMGLRVLRVFPALAVEVLLSAFIVGPMFTTLYLSDYF